MTDSGIPNDNEAAAAQVITSDQLHWRTKRLLDLPPVLLVTIESPLIFREALATHIDGRRTNDLLSSAIAAIEREYDLQPHAYVVAFHRPGIELPIDLRAIVDEPGHFAGIVHMPRTLHVAPFPTASLDTGIAGDGLVRRREFAIHAYKEMTRSGPDLSLADIADTDGRFMHHFSGGVYHHSYRSVSALITDTGE